MKVMYSYFICNIRTHKAYHVYDKLKVQSQEMLIQTIPSSQC